MTDEQRLIDRLRLVEALFAGAATPGEREAAAHARERIRARLRTQEQTDPAIEYTFKFHDLWSRKLFVALLRRYQLRPYRYARQRYTTVMVRVPVSFVKETLWPEFLELNRTLTAYLTEMTDRVIAQGIEADASDVEVRTASASLGPAPSLGDETA